MWHLVVHNANTKDPARYSFDEKPSVEDKTAQGGRIFTVVSGTLNDGENVVRIMFDNVAYWSLTEEKR